MRAVSTMMTPTNTVLAVRTSHRPPMLSSIAAKTGYSMATPEIDDSRSV